MKVSAIIPAAGQGLRMGGRTPKQFLNLNGKPILDYTLQAFQQCEILNSVILSVPQSEKENATKQWLGSPPKVHQVVTGGEKRQDSVFNGFKAVETDTDIVVIHDGVRPFVTSQLIEDTIQAARKYGAAITAIPVNDTLKKGKDDFVENTVSREGLWRVQTPQAFTYELLNQAFEKANRDSFYGTDEGSLIEHLGEPVKIVMGSEWNIKITRVDDLVLGEHIAKKTI